MASYSRDGSRSGSIDNLDDDGREQRGYTRQYQPRSGQGVAPPVYTQHDQYRRPHAGSTTSSQAAASSRYAERSEPRSHSPRRYEDPRPQDQYFPSRSHSPASYASRGQSPGRYDEQSAPRHNQPPERSYSPARSQPPQGGYSHSGPQPTQRYQPQQQYPPQQYPQQGGYARQPQAGYPASQSGYAPSQSSYAPSRGVYQKGPSQSSYGAPGRGGYQSRSNNGYTPLNAAALYATRHPRPLHKTETKEGGYYNVYTDSVVKTKKLRTKAGMTNFLAVSRPWSKNHSNQPRDFMPLVIASIFFMPPVGLAALVLSCFTMRAVTEEDWAKAGLYGRITFWMSIAAIISGILFFIILFASLHNGFFVPGIH